MTEEPIYWDHPLGPYYVEKSRWGTYKSVHKDGTPMVTAATEEACRIATEHIHLPFYRGSDSSDIHTTSYDDISTDELK